MITRLSGNSMEPFLRDGDVLRLRLFEQPLELEAHHLGRIFLARDHGEWVIHRAVRGTRVWC